MIFNMILPQSIIGIAEKVATYKMSIQSNSTMSNVKIGSVFVFLLEECNHLRPSNRKKRSIPFVLFMEMVYSHGVRKM